MTKKKTYGISTGTSSLLVVIVILSLICFAGLSIVSASADYKLSKKLADRTTTYYTQTSEANKQLSLLSEAFSQIYATSNDESAYFAKIKESYADSLTYSYPISDTQELKVSVHAVYPKDGTGEFLAIDQFQVVTTQELKLDDSLPVLFHD
ncbi:MAG: hypothetical protein IJ420_02365 [Lachnospiraceae bacterium]|nr:hypothetical protein [Lachnospiraceae bacterium]